MRLMLTGGGTGGHIYPALAIARACLERCGPGPVLFVGARGGMEQELVPAAGFDFVGLPVRGLVRKRPAEAAAALGPLVAAVLQALGAVRRFRPDVVVGTGGYAAGPVGRAAVLRRTPLVLQEQNAVPGVTNRLLAPFAAAVAVPYPAARAHFPSRTRLLVAGNPVRPGLGAGTPAEARRRLGLPGGARLVLMMAGSRGSAVFVRLLGELLPHLTDGILLFVSGREHHAAALRAAAGHERRVRVLPYLEAVGDAWVAADLVVCRAGAMTLAELAAVGRAALLIPSLHVTHHHQEANAAAFAASGAAEVLPEPGLDGRVLAAAIGRLLADPGRRAVLAAAARGLDRPDALRQVVDAILAAARRR